MIVNGTPILYAEFTENRKSLRYMFPNTPMLLHKIQSFVSFFPNVALNTHGFGTVTEQVHEGDTNSLQAIPSKVDSVYKITMPAHPVVGQGNARYSDELYQAIENMEIVAPTGFAPFAAAQQQLQQPVVQQAPVQQPQFAQPAAPLFPLAQFSSQPLVEQRPVVQAVPSQAQQSISPGANVFQSPVKKVDLADSFKKQLAEQKLAPPEPNPLQDKLNQSLEKKKDEPVVETHDLTEDLPPEPSWMNKFKTEEVSKSTMEQILQELKDMNSLLREALSKE